jgi:hypothetical protein
MWGGDFMGGLLALLFVPLEDTKHTFTEGCRIGGAP